MRLRDGAMILEDYNLWQPRDIMGPANCEEDSPRRPGGFLWHCADIADAGARNGRNLRHLAQNYGRPIARYEFIHIIEAAKSLKPDGRRGLRAVTHLAEGRP